MAQGSVRRSPSDASARLGPTTPVPNFLLDEVMPTLADTAWRLLCVIVRATLGWQTEEGRRKERDWLTHTQLKTRTGRGSAAICAGVEELARRSLIEAQDMEGHPLVTPQERRRAGGRIYYRLHPQLVHPQTGISSVPGQAARSTAAESEAETSQIKKGFSGEGFHKAKTTKEKQKKEILIKSESLLFPQSENPDWIDENLPPVHQGIEREPSKAAMVEEVFANDLPGVLPLTEGVPLQDEDEVHQSTEQEVTAQAFIERFCAFYREYRGEGSVPLISTGDRALLRQRLAQHPAETLEKWLPVFFQSRFGYVRRRNYSLESFLHSLYILQTARTTPGAHRNPSNGIEQICWVRPAEIPVGPGHSTPSPAATLDDRKGRAENFSA